MIHLLLIALDLGRVLMEVLAFGCLVDDTSADRPVAEMLTLVALFGIPRQEVLKDLEDLFFHDRAAIELVQTFSVIAAAEVHVAKSEVSIIEAGQMFGLGDILSTVSLANEGSFSEPRAGTPVGTAGHAEDDAVLRETVLLKTTLELRDQLWQVSF